MMKRSPMLVLAASLAASTAAFAQNAAAPPKKAEVSVERAPKSAHCTVNRASICKDDGTCAPTHEVAGLKLPIKVTFDFQNRVLMGVDKDGFPTSSPIGGLFGGGKLLVAQGFDDGVGWVWHGTASDLKMSFSMASHHTVLSAFGTCEIDND